MSLKESLDGDIASFFRDIENQNLNDQKLTLKLLIDKYAHLSSSEFVMDKADLEFIVSSAKGIFATKTMPVFLGKGIRKVYEGDQAALCIIEATIGHLNKSECLKKLPKFDYREDK